MTKELLSDIKWHNEKRKLSELKPLEYNPRQATEKQVKDLTTSLTYFNLVDPIIINSNNTIIGGHLRYHILKNKYDKNKIIDVRVPNRLLTPEEERELNLRLNKNTGEWNFDLLANYDENLLLDVGFEKEELDEIFGLDIDDDFDVEKELNKVLASEKRRCKNNELWQLGDHRLYIGDATKRESWEKVLKNEKFDFLFTDPPYRLAYTQRMRKVKTKEEMELKKIKFI